MLDGKFIENKGGFILFPPCLDSFLYCVKFFHRFGRSQALSTDGCRVVTTLRGRRREIGLPSRLVSSKDSPVRFSRSVEVEKGGWSRSRGCQREVFIDSSSGGPSSVSVLWMFDG